jgi:hypothetical protein
MYDISVLFSGRKEFFFQHSTLVYMTKTLNQIIFFFLHQNQNIFFSNIGNQNFFLEKNHNPPTHTATVLTSIKANVKEDKIVNTPMCVKNVERYILDKYAQKNEEPNFHRANFQLANNCPKLPQNKLVHLINKFDNNSVVNLIKVDKFEHWFIQVLYFTNEIASSVVWY